MLEFQFQFVLIMLLLPFVGAALGIVVNSRFLQLIHKPHQGVAVFAFRCLACDKELAQSTFPSRAELFTEDDEWEEWYICEGCFCKTLDGPILLVEQNAKN